MKSYSPYVPLQDQNEKSWQLGKDLVSLVMMRMERSPQAVFVSSALQIPWATTEIRKSQVCLEGSLSLEVFGTLFFSTSWSPPCLR